MANHNYKTNKISTYKVVNKSNLFLNTSSKVDGTKITDILDGVAKSQFGSDGIKTNQDNDGRTVLRFPVIWANSTSNTATNINKIYAANISTIDRSKLVKDSYFILINNFNLANSSSSSYNDVVNNVVPYIGNRGGTSSSNYYYPVYLCGSGNKTDLDSAIKAYKSAGYTFIVSESLTAPFIIKGGASFAKVVEVYNGVTLRFYHKGYSDSGSMSWGDIEYIGEYTGCKATKVELVYTGNRTNAELT